MVIKQYVKKLRFEFCMIAEFVFLIIVLRVYCEDSLEKFSVYRFLKIVIYVVMSVIWLWFFFFKLISKFLFIICFLFSIIRIIKIGF